MARRPDLVGLTVLAMLSVRASHPYELHRFIVDTHKDYVTGLPRSLYHAVEKLAGEELIVPVETGRQGRRPERTVYEITEEGRGELSTRLRALLENPVPDRRTFTAAISLIGALPVPEALRALRTRAATLEGLLAGMDAHLRALEDGGLPDVLMIEVDYERAMKGTELAWVRRIIARLESGELDWPGTVRQDLLSQVLGEP
ncbi:PadR family transcriptional regulator [Planomonospora venezuelensis]|uniref:DNA-binding PadR family transcriptional regulator n=1 Tax=Planomonospora venezuelensis TaxID=1999 RepID=A0A841CXB2_PLAVE|nr:PadR family transcriptional regulator [Planomonospora venezuelensis]MBB5962040.1 DNA-binding PadR family transcriptional regulator [Planomonospora venezuelensis]GIN00140.1 PadR family transcriptional regulator [Planomonospora venezuelensis]